MIKKILLVITVAVSVLYGQNNDDQNRFMLGQSYIQTGELAKARDIFTELYNTNPLNTQYFHSLNDVLVKLKEYDSSIKLIEQGIARAPQDINLYGMLGSTYYLMQKEEKAFQVWDDALKMSGNAIGYRVIANYAIERRAFDKAIQVLKEGKKLAEDPSIFSFDLAHLYIMTMGYKDAASELCLIISQNPNQLNAVENRLFSYINKPEALSATISVFEECKKEDNIAFSYLLARLYKEQKNFTKAYELYKEIDGKQGNQGTELFNFAQTVYNEGEYQTASEIFNDIIEKYPNSPFVSSAKLGYAKTTEVLISAEEDSTIPSWKPYYINKHNSSGKIDGVISTYKDIAKLYPHSDVANEALLRIGKLKFNYQNDPAGAKEYFLMIIKNSPVSHFTADAYNEMAKISLIEGNLDEASGYLEKAISSGRSEQEKKNLARYKLANIYFYRGDFNQSKELLNTILDNLKDNTANDAIELSLLLNTTMNDSSNLLVFAEGELLAEQKKFEEAKEKYKQIEQNPKGFMLVHLSKIRVAEMTLAQDSLETSIALLSKIADEKEKNIYADKALYLLGKVYQFGMNNPAKAVEIYESLLAKFPNSLYLDGARDAILHLRNKLS